jgi:hypothetical protein
MGSARTGSSTKVEDMSDFRQYLGSMLNIWWWLIHMQYV